MEERLLSPAFVALTLSDLAYFTAAGVLLFATPTFASDTLGAGPLAIGLVMGSFSVTTLLLRPWAGGWTDRHGRRALLVGGAAAFAIVASGHLLVSGVLGLVSVRLLLGAAEACYFVAGFAALADLAPRTRTGEALSLNSLALYVGIGVGPLVGQLLVDMGGYDAAWWGVVVLAACAAGIASRVPETHGDRAAGSASSLLVHRATLVPGAALGCGLLTLSGFMAFAVLLAREVDLRPLSLALLVYGATVVGCRIAFASLPDRVDPGSLAVGALAAGAVGMLAVGLLPTAVGLLCGAFVCGLGAAFLMPAVFARVFRDVPSGERGSAAGTLSLFLDLGLSAGPMALGLLAGASGLKDAFWMAAVVPTAGAVLLWSTPTRRMPLLDH